MVRTPRTALAVALACAAALAPAAEARNTQELGAPSGLAFPKADCPKNAAQPTDPSGCQAIARLTGYNLRLNGVHNPMRVKRSGYVVAFTVELAKPDAEQTTFFKNQYGAHPQARLALIRSLHTENKYKLLKQTQAFDLEPYFGSTPTIALRTPFRVHKDDIVAITVPTWLPAFAHNLDDQEIWRSSHEKAECAASDPPAATHDKIDSEHVYDCTYKGARLLYTATFIGDPKPTNIAAKR